MESAKLILLPGLDGTGELFEPLLDVISKERSIKIIRYPVDKNLGYDELVEYVGKIIKNENSIYLVAESFSGPIAIKLLSKYKNKIKGVVLIASFISLPRRLLLNLAKLLPMNFLLKYEIPNYLIRRYCLGKEINGEIIAKFKKVIKLVKPSVLLHRLDEMSRLDVNAFDPVCNINVYYIKASNDKLVKKESLLTLKSIIKVYSVVVDGPHFLLQAKPSECGKLILKYTKP